MTGLERLNAFASVYRRRGFNPLPSRANDGRIYPPFTYSAARDDGLSERSFLGLARDRDCDCIQVATGVRWGLVVLDLDGPTAVEVWTLWSMHRENPPTWAVRHDPSGGMHLWYRVPCGTPLPHRTVLWSMPSESHTMIELIGDGGLIVAPPSVSPRSGNEYAFSSGRGPDAIPEPADLPAWVLDLAGKANAPRCGVVTPRNVSGRERVFQVLPLPGRGASHLDRDAVLSCITDPIGLAMELGLRIVGTRENGSGWVRARSIFREDKVPSAMFSVSTFRWWEPEFGHRPISIFDAAVLLGHAADYSEAVDVVGGRLGVRSDNKAG